MSTELIPIKVPAVGEGLEEARLLQFFKQPGDAIAKDEPIYQLETDKAVVDIESPSAGALESWTAKEGGIVAIGAVIGYVKP
ncbi:MAG: lipoyl domain-containing protein [Verrucomicrobiales bacterium]|jgi:pyruvate dehydrogenase E2 component (dihydrolipoamide acetyltransferase)|nr:lipoyl domain-containing protein [Verrucomicrobiales bacterium]MDR1305757.1 lipoyl domain-containing protein [Verrucomicrobiales bacterium]